jgi:hypothetical protein
MYSFTLIQQLGQAVTPLGAQTANIFFTRIELLYHQNRLESGVLYLGGRETFEQLCAAWEPQTEAVLVLADTTPAHLERKEGNFPACVLLSRLPLAALYNRISAAMQRQAPPLLDTWRQILARRLVSGNEIKALLFPEHAADVFYLQQLLLCPMQGIVTDQLSQELSGLFPEASIIPGEKEITVLRRHDSQLFRFPLPDGLERWLKERSCILCVGNATRDMSMMRTGYLLLHQLLRLGKLLRRPEEYILRLEDYQTMLILDDCAREYVRQHDHQDLCYLAHPALIHICRYDAKYGANLREVLYQYLRFGGNMQRTAEALYMHRNTVLNKLKKIEEIIPLDLSDGIFCQQLLLSCQLLEYMEKVLKQSINWGRSYD